MEEESEKERDGKIDYHSPHYSSGTSASLDGVASLMALEGDEQIR